MFAIPTNVEPAFVICAPILSECFADSAMLALGGGTVLAGRWAHRLSTDLDFFVHADPARVAALVTRASERLDKEPHIENLVVRSRYLTFTCAGTEVSVFSSTAMTGQRPWERDTGTGVLIETTEEILARKLYGRIMGLGDFVARDFYDLCVASWEDPEAYAAATARLSVADVADILAELDGVSGSGKPVLAPKYIRLAADLWRHSRILLESGQLSRSLFDVRDTSAGDSAQ